MINSHATHPNPPHLKLYGAEACADGVLAAHILVIGENAGRPHQTVDQLNEFGANVTSVHTRAEASRLLANQHFQVVVHDVSDCSETTFSEIGELAAASRPVPHVVVAHCPVELPQLRSLAKRPFSIVLPPVNTVTLYAVLRQALVHAEVVADNTKLARQLALRGTHDIVGHSAGIADLRQRILRLSQVETPVLIQGEAGTGKQLVARVLHDMGPRAHRPFITLDCSILTAAHLERELYGDTAVDPFRGGEPRPGRLDLAAGGTLVLQNIDDMAFMIQAEFASVLRERQFRRLGDNEYRPLDTQIVATTRYDVRHQARQGLFHEDLLREIGMQVLPTPTLRDHRDDVAALTEHFLRQIALKQGMLAKRIPASTMDILVHYAWPGNVQELGNLIERACAIDCGPKLTPEVIRPWLAAPAEDLIESEAGMSLKEMERKLIESTFARYAGNREKTAQALQIGLRTLSGKLRDYGYPPRGGPGSNQPRKRAA